MTLKEYIKELQRIQKTYDVPNNELIIETLHHKVEVQCVGFESFDDTNSTVTITID